MPNGIERALTLTSAGLPDAIGDAGRRQPDLLASGIAAVFPED